MDAETATAILSAASEGGWYENGTVLEGDALIEEGEYFLVEARKALDSGMTDDSIKKIIEIGEGEAQPHDEGAAAPLGMPSTSLAEQERGPADAPADPPPPERGAEGGRAAEERGADPSGVGAPLGERLPVPSEIEGDPTPIPRDLTTLNDRDVRKLHGENNAFLARATWVVAVISSDLRNAETLRDNAYRKALRKAAAAEKRTKDILDAEAKEDADYQSWNDRVSKHEDDLEKLKALKEIYKGTVSALSREASMRSDEFQRAGGK